MKKFKLHKHNGKYAVLVRTKLFQWRFVKWRDNKKSLENHSYGEYCLFNDIDDAMRVGKWCTEGQDKITEWIC